MKKQIGIFVLVLMSTLYVNVEAQQKALTLDEVIQIALENNPEVRIAKMDIDKANAAVSEAFGYALPSVDITGNFSYFLEKPKMLFPDFQALLGSTVYTILEKEKLVPESSTSGGPPANKLQSFAQTNNFEAKAQVTQILFNSAVLQGIGATQIYLETSEFAYKAKKSKIVLDVTTAFNQVLLTKEILNILQASFENANDNLKNVNALHKEGLVSDYTQMQVEVQVENIKPQLLEVQDGLKMAFDGLKMTMGLDPNMDIEIKGNLKYETASMPNLNESIEIALDNNLDIKTFKMKQQIDNALIEIDRSEYWPTIAAFGSYAYNGMSDDFNFMTYSSALVGLSFTMNLFQGNRTSRKVQQSKIAYDQTTIQRTQLEDFVKMQIKSKLDELQRVKSLLRAQSRTIELAQRAYELSLINFKEGTGTQLEIKNADIELSVSKMNRLKSVFQYISAKSSLDHLMGKLIK